MPSAIVERATAGPWRSEAWWKLPWDGFTAALSKVRVRKKHRALRLQETLPLGERRFLAVVQWGNEKLLLGVTAQSISLLEPHAKKEASGYAWEEEPKA